MTTDSLLENIANAAHRAAALAERQGHPEYAAATFIGKLRTVLADWDLEHPTAVGAGAVAALDALQRTGA